MATDEPENRDKDVSAVWHLVGYCEREISDIEGLELAEYFLACAQAEIRTFLKRKSS
jgi:hypothetical protein